MLEGSGKFFVFPIPHLTNNTVNGIENITFSRNSLTLHYPCPRYTECSPYTLVLPTGSYLLEVWGAQGGGGNIGISFKNGGKGGYSSGVLCLDKESIFYVYVGSSGVLGNGNGGFNGGGAMVSINWLNQSNPRSPGGGASDIRTVFGSETKILRSKDFETKYYGPMESLTSRIIVGGGGGGSNPGGYGIGNETGPSIVEASSGSQTEGGRTNGGPNGGFGYGGFSSNQYMGISGGGGGYYGGGGSTFAYGGSCFVNSEVLKNGRIVSGNQPFPSPFGGKEEGHAGNGAVRITYLDMRIVCSANCFRYNYLFLLTFCVSLFAS